MDDKQVPQQGQGQAPGQVQIKADEKELQGMYSNLVMIQHHAEEFTLNFVYVFPNATQGKLLSSMIVSPGHAKRIWRALGENISRFEALLRADQGGPEEHARGKHRICAVRRRGECEILRGERSGHARVPRRGDRFASA